LQSVVNKKDQYLRKNVAVCIGKLLIQL